MTQFDDRGFEANLAQDQEKLLRIIARRNRLLGEWAAGLMGLSDVESDAYAKDLVRADFEGGGGDDVVLKLLGDITGAGIEVDEECIREALKQKLVEARRQLIG